MNDQTITRRSLLGKTAASAAAAAVVAAILAIADAAPGLKVPVNTQRDAWDELTATLSDEQMAILYRVDAEHGEGWIDEQGVLVEELKRHLPAFAIAIELAYQHVTDQRVALRGRCCSGTPVEGETRYI
jgi:hypothetical protein